MTAIATASAGISAAFDRIDRAANIIAAQSAGQSAADKAPIPANDSDPTIKAVLDLESSRQSVEANAAVLRAGTRMSTHLVDILV